MMYNDVTIQSNARGGSTLAGTFNRASNLDVAVLFSHNSHGSKEDEVLLNLEANFLNAGVSTLRYNFHYVDKIPVEEANFEDIMADFDAAYTFLLNQITVRGVCLIGKSIGGVASMKYCIDNSLKSPIVILGFFLPGVEKYIGDREMKKLRSDVLIVQGDKDQYSKPPEIRAYLGRAGIKHTLYELVGASHNLLSSDENIRKSEDLLAETIDQTLNFVLSPSS